MNNNKSEIDICLCYWGKSKVDKRRRTRISQGDVFRDVECIEYVVEKKGIIEVSKIVFPLIIVLTQDCDL